MRQVRVSVSVANLWALVQGVAIALVLAGAFLAMRVPMSDPCRTADWWFLFVDCWGW